MFISEKQKLQIEDNVLYLREKIEVLEKVLKRERVIPTYYTHASIVDDSISLVELKETQQKILDHLNVELKTTPEKTELVEKEKV